MGQPTLGVIFGNRDFFPDVLVTEARADIQTLFSELGIRGIWLSEQDSKLGSVETFAKGMLRAYVGDGRFTDDPLDTFGSRAVVEVPDLQDLLKYICRNGFEHHTAMTAAPSADILAEAFETYFDWDIYHH